MNSPSPLLSSTVAVIRAVGAAYARRIIRPFIVGGSVLVATIVGGSLWFTTQNAWWWIVAFIVICGAILFAIIVTGIFFVIRRVEPKLTKAQRKDVNAFVDKLERVAEHLQTPQFMIVYYVIRDTIRPRPDGFIQHVSQDSRTLAPDFEKLRRTI